MNISIDYIRDGLIEEFHEGIFERLTESDFSLQPYYLRSCAKPLQATLLIDYGVQLEERELALICGSHAGEECHIELAQNLLKKFGLNKNQLKCGIHSPLSRTMQDKMLLEGKFAESIHNNCSGKHIGFLILCKINNWDIETYYKPDHPLQVEIKNKINKLCEVEASYPITTDGCGVPILSMPLHNMLIGYKNLIKYEQIINAIMHFPYIFGGENRLDTEIIEKTDSLIAKVGAGGLCIVFNIKENDGFIIKINDCSMEARRFAVLEIINKLGWGKIDYNNKITTLHGDIVGEIKVSI